MLLLAHACSGDKAPEDSSSALCEILVDETVPINGSTDAYYRGPIEFHLSDPDPTATITGPVTGTVTRSEDAEIVYFTPDDPLSPSTTYTFALEYCRGSADLSFTTSAVGSTPVSDPTTLIGRTWSFDLAQARIVSPDGMSLVLSTVPQEPLLISVTAVGSGTLDFIEGGADTEGEAETQDYCLPTTDLPSADFSENPYFDLSATSATVAVGGAPVTVNGMRITGVFAADGSALLHGTLSGLLDTRNMGVLVGDEGNPAAACDMMVAAGIRCGECPDGGMYCIDLLADQITAPEVVGLTMATVPGTNCEGCADGPPAEDAICEE